MPVTFRRDRSRWQNSRDQRSAGGWRCLPPQSHEPPRGARRILVDTSVWVDHLRRGDSRLRELLLGNEVLIHPFLVGELTLVEFGNRSEILSLLEALPQAVVAEHAEVMGTVGRNRLHGKGIGWIEAHLLASAPFSGAGLLIRVKALSHAAGLLRIAA